MKKMRGNRESRKSTHISRQEDFQFRGVVQFRRALLKWFQGNQRSLPWRDSRDPYAIWVSEVMLQQTQVRTVMPYYRRFMEKFPDVQALAAADLQEVLKVWEGLGYYARARNLHRAARQVVAERGGSLPNTFQEWLKLPGVGEYIAAAVSSIVFGESVPVLDGNVRRVLSRLFQIEVPINHQKAYKSFYKVAEGLLDKNAPGQFNQAMMELGALICKPSRPECGICPVNRWCKAFQNRTQSEYPKRVKKAPIPHYRIAVGVILRDGKVLITRRKSEGLLGGLWEFPGGKLRDGETPEAACIREIREEVGLEVNIVQFIKRVQHAYSHFRITMDVFLCKYVSGDVELNSAEAYRWVKPVELEQFPFPGANRKFISVLKEILDK